MSANIGGNGKVRQLDRRAEPDEIIRPEEVGDTTRLARLLMKMLRNLAKLLSRWSPRRLDFEDQTVDATGVTQYRFPHSFGGRVRYWPIEWSGATAPNLVKDASSDNSTLVLTSTSAGVLTLRVEEAG